MGKTGRWRSVRHCLLCYVVVVAILVGAPGLGGCSSDREQPITFPDPNLEAAIRQAIGRPSGDIHKTDLQGLISFAAPGEGIANLSGLQHATSLTHLYLPDNQVSDISALAGLASLIELHLEWNQISDASPLTGLSSLTVLNLCENQLGSISALGSLIGLRELSLDGNQISDISALEGLTGLKELYLYANQVSDISVLASLTSLTTIELGENQISDISPLVANTGLAEGHYVVLMGNPLSAASLDDYIPQLQARGVTVLY